MSLRNELLQVAAVAIAIVSDLDKYSTAVHVIDGSAEWDGDYQKIMDDLLAERLRQEEKWGTRYEVPIAEWLVILGEEYGEACQAALEEVMYPKEEQ